MTFYALAIGIAGLAWWQQAIVAGVVVGLTGLVVVAILGVRQ